MSQQWEVEQKYRLPDPTKLRAALAERGFVCQETQQHCDIYFRHPCRDFRESGEAFRLRQQDELCMVTYKGRREGGEVKTRPEIELGLLANDLDSWQELLEHLGFAPVPAVRKRREVFRHPADSSLGEFCVTIDSVEQLGSFAEIELLVSEKTALPAAQKRILDLGNSLGLVENEPRSYLAQLLTTLGLE